jgi:hypothetical protein
MDNKKSIFFGLLYQADSAVELAHREIEKLWNEGQIRMVPHDFAKIDQAITHVHLMLKMIEEHRDEFKSIQINHTQRVTQTIK